MAHIVELVHKQASLTDALYYLGPMNEVWEGKGHTITVLRGTDRFVEADIAILHVNLTVVPDEYLEFMKRYPKTINANIADISKRQISTHLVGRGDGYKGPVIVKTNLNYGGKIEAKLGSKGSKLVRYRNALRRRLHWTLSAEISSIKYPVYQSVSQVPWPVWHNPDLVVEKFQPEMQGELYCLRSYMFLGDHETSALFTSRDPVIKGENFLERFVVDLPDEVREMRREMKFEFGKFDFVMVDGRVVLYDVNRTPTLGLAKPESYMPRVRILADGLDSFL